MKATKTGRKRKPSRKPFLDIPIYKTLPCLGRKPIIGAEVEVIATKNLEALLTHYGIPGGINDPKNGWLLAMLLATDAVKGFAEKPTKPKRGRGRPHKLGVGLRDLFLCAIGTEAKREGRDEHEAVKALGERWRREGRCKWSDKSLWRLYQRLDPRAPTPGMIQAAAFAWRQGWLSDGS